MLAAVRSAPGCFVQHRLALDVFFCFLFPHIGTQRLPSYNLWVCPHCEGGVKAADVTDLSCEHGEEKQSGSFNWPWIKVALHRFLHSFTLEPQHRNIEDVNPLLDLAGTPFEGFCFLGMMALGLFSLHFIDREDRWDMIKTTMFGGVTFQRAVPLSYWDVYSSGWPIFGLLATATVLIQNDVASGGHYLNFSNKDSAVGASGIDLRPRQCCDFPDGKTTNDDQQFLLALSEYFGGDKWLRTHKTVPIKLSLDYLARTAHRRCSSGRACAYFALTESLLSAPSMSGRLWNSTQALMSLGEQNLDGCEANITIYHHWHSVWPFWQILGRLEHRQLALHKLTAVVGPGLLSYMTPPALPSLINLKWEHLLRSRGLDTQGKHHDVHTHAQPAVTEDFHAAPWDAESCLDGFPGLVHVAFSADVAQIDGLIVALQSAIQHAASNASRLCFHTFALRRQSAFVIEALECAFKSAFTSLPVHAGRTWEGAAFLIHNSSRLLLHNLDEERVRRTAGLEADADFGDSVNGSEKSKENAVIIGETDIRAALASDTGNLEAIHNFVRFLLHEFLPALSRVVYLDVDIVVKGDLCELYDTPLLTEGGAQGTVAAVQRSNQALRVYVNVLQPAIPKWLPSEAPSFNAGVMVIDLARWRSRNASRFIAEWVDLKSKDNKLWLGQSQPPLLLLFHDEVAPLHWSWNVDGLGHRLNYPKSVLQEARLLHWTGPLKPWKHHGVNRFLWERYTMEYCPTFSFREHTTTCRPDSWHC